MQTKSKLRQILALALAAAPLGALAQTTFFTDNFANGSTTNKTSVRSGSPTASYTSYDIASSKTTVGYTAIAARDLHLTLSTGTTSGFLEAQALFATNGRPVTLTAVGDYIDMAVVFTNTGGTLLAGGSKSAVWVGLFNSGGTLTAANPPVAGALANSGLTTTAGSAYAAGNCANWQGYVAQITSGGATRIITRPQETGALTDSANQELLGNNAASGMYANPTGAVIETAPVAAVPLTAGGVYTLQFTLTLNAPNSLTVSNTLYSGAGYGGTVLLAQGSATGITNATYLTGGFDGLAIGAFNSGTTYNPTMDISSIVISGQSTAVTAPPTITSEPVPVAVVNGGACEFVTTAVGFGVNYQWYRNNTPLTNNSHISGATSGTLIISPATAADAFGGANGYYAVVSGTGGYSTTTTTNALTIIASTNLTWSGAGTDWDLNTSPNWNDPGGNPAYFNYGDPVTFDDTGAANTSVTLTGSYLSAAAVTINSQYNYSFSGTGSFAGPGTLIYANSPFLSINTPNTYSGGTLISNTTSPLHLYLQNYNGLGTGPVWLNNNPAGSSGGGLLEIVPGGSSSLGIAGTVVVQDDFTIQADTAGTYATVLLGDLAGTAGKTLSIVPKTPGTVNRIRAYGINTVYNGNLALATNDSPVAQAMYTGTTLDPYGSSGSQTYNGIISGYGGIIQRGGEVTALNGQNTYSGGTFATAGTLAFGTDTTVDGSQNVLSGPIGTGPLFLTPESGSANGSGTVEALNGARTVANPIQYPSSTNNQTLVIAGTNALNFTGPISLAGLDGATNIVNRPVTVNNTNTLTTFSGVMDDGGFGFGLVKSGPGNLALNNNETYTGATTVSGGTLFVNGQLPSASVTVTNASLGGTGTIAGPVTVATNGFITPGNTAIGTLTVNNSLTNAGGWGIKVNKSVAPANDAVAVSGALINPGTGVVTVTNLGPALVAGDRFVLFSKPLVNGGALTISGGGTGILWTNKLAVDGSIMVVPSVATNPTNITFSVSGGSLNLTWPANHTGWRLQVQTNTLAAGLNPATNAWYTVPNSTTVNTLSLPINPANKAVFYRLVYP